MNSAASFLLTALTDPGHSTFSAPEAKRVLLTLLVQVSTAIPDNDFSRLQTQGRSLLSNSSGCSH